MESHPDAIADDGVSNPIPSAGPCPVWRHGLSERGYGEIQLENSTDLAHRLAYRTTRGGIPVGARILHLCRNAIFPSSLRSPAEWLTYVVSRSPCPPCRKGIRL